MNGMPLGWNCEEPGWWTHDTFGGVCHEDDGKWYGYPKHLPELDRRGPFDTANAAASAIQQHAAVPA